MWPRFQLSRNDQNNVLALTHLLQVLFAFSAGTLLILSPQRRYGASYQFIFEIDPHGDDILGYPLLVAGLVMLYALRYGRTRLMGFALLSIGVVCWVFGTFLLLGALAGPTGVLGTIFCFYTGGHMIIQSLIYTRGEKRQK